MKVAEVRRIVERDIAGICERLGIPHWKVKVAYDLRAEHPDTEALGQCTRLYDYEQAFIHLDAGGLEDEDHVLRVLRHELFHILLAPYDMHANIAEDLVDGDRRLEAAVARVWRHAMEKTVINLERMYQGLTSPGPPRSEPAKRKAP